MYLYNVYVMPGILFYQHCEFRKFSNICTELKMGRGNKCLDGEVNLGLMEDVNDFNPEDGYALFSKRSTWDQNIYIDIFK